MRCQIVRGRPRRRARGYTLLEIMVAIVILGLISSITTVAVLDVLTRARIDTTKEAIRSAEDCLKLFALRNGRYPTTAEGFGALVSGRFMPKEPRDGWGQPLRYEGGPDSYTITSFGGDQQPGGDGANRDLTQKDL